MSPPWLDEALPQRAALDLSRSDVLAVCCASIHPSGWSRINLIALAPVVVILVRSEPDFAAAGLPCALSTAGHPRPPAHARGIHASPSVRPAFSAAFPTPTIHPRAPGKPWPPPLTLTPICDK